MPRSVIESGKFVNEQRQTDPTSAVVVLCKGLGSRLTSVATGTHKTMEVVGGRPLLWWILHEIRAAGGLAATRVVLRDPDPAAESLCASFGGGITVEHSAPTGYLCDVYTATAAHDGEATIVEGDTFLAPGALRTFLLTRDSLPTTYGLAVAVAPPPASWDFPVQWVVLGPGGDVVQFSRDIAPSSLMAAGVWHWRPRAVARMRDALDGGLSLTSFVASAIADGVAVRPVGVAAAFNINTPASLTLAREWAATAVRS